ncbi:glucokinase [Flaviflagellibacter deserti]|uniref:Glucokinase n=1 Tax=Flaviflagellibacter deserti TaxID=2267266 RepID=A0ABV9Z7T1_9HYPH
MSNSDFVLVADIGGTNSRFGIVRAGSMTPEAVSTLDNDNFNGLGEAIPGYLEHVGVKPNRAVLAIAGPIKDGTVHLTNRRGWSFKPEELARDLGMSRVEVVNDFAGIAWALPHLRADELEPLGEGEARSDATKVVLGPGTGLGVAALLYDNGRWVIVPSEAGHVELAATTAREEAIFAAVRADFGRVSAESVLSGPGLARLDQAISLIDGVPTETRKGQDVSIAAREGDVTAKEAVDIFFTALARFAGDMALSFLAQGGVYIYGGVAQKNADLMDVVKFRDAFSNKAPHQKLVSNISTKLITSPQPALTGCAAIAAEKA